jgi:hypothetical protein
VDLASEFGVSRERIRQINVSSFEKVQKAVKNRVAAMGTRRFCGCVSLQPIPLVGKTDDGRVAAGTCQPNDARGAPLTVR